MEQQAQTYLKDKKLIVLIAWAKRTAKIYATSFKTSAIRSYLLAFVVGYALAIDFKRARDLACAIDNKIPHHDRNFDNNLSPYINKTVYALVRNLNSEEFRALSNYLYILELIVRCKESAVIRVSPRVWNNIELRMITVSK